MNLPNVTLSATTFRLYVNTTTASVDDALVNATDGDLLAGPYLQVEAIGGHLGVADERLMRLLFSSKPARQRRAQARA